MLDIYCDAHKFIIWLVGGDEVHVQNGAIDTRTSGSSTSDALDFISRLVDVHELERMTSRPGAVDEESAASCRSFAKLLRRAWFGRRWGIQEVGSRSQSSLGVMWRQGRQLDRICRCCQSHTVREYLERMQAVIWGRKFINRTGRVRYPVWRRVAPVCQHGYWP